MAAIYVEPGNSKRIRRSMSELRLAGQNFIHFAKERDARRKMILSRLSNLDIRARIYVVQGSNTYSARSACILRIIEDAEQVRASKLVLELDESVRQRDEVLVISELRRRGIRQMLDFQMLGKNSEPILWCADAIVWSYNRGGDFRRRAMKLIESVNQIHT